jgi:hypothetical protein
MSHDDFYLRKPGSQVPEVVPIGILVGPEWKSIGNPISIAFSMTRSVRYLPSFTPVEMMPRCSAAGSPIKDLNIIPAGFNAPLEFLTGFTLLI